MKDLIMDTSTALMNQPLRDSESHSVSNYRQKIKKIEYWMKNYTKVSLHTLNIVHNKYINIFYIFQKNVMSPHCNMYILHITMHLYLNDLYLM